MPRNRVIYQSQAVSVTSDKVSFDADAITNGSISGLQRIQSANYSFSVGRQDVNQFGQLARIDAVSIDPPTVSLDYSYYLTNGINEKLIGFNDIVKFKSSLIIYLLCFVTSSSK